MKVGKGAQVPTTAKTAAQRKAAERQRARSAGYVLRQFWIHPKDWPRVQKYLKRFGINQEAKP